MEFQSVDYTIDTLVQRIRTSRLALPDFQREFVWKPNEVVELLDSVARQWPIGSLLLLSGPQPFATKEIESGPKVSRDELDSYVLDGQQRITSLYHAIMDVSEYCYYVDFSALEREGDEYIQWERRDRFYKQFPTIEKRAAAKIALVKEVWDSQNFYKWIECLEEPSLKFSYVSLRDLHLGGLQTKVYKVMAIELQQEISLEALARIFETLNRTGVRLNAFDLMVAALYPSGFKLKDEWEAALNDYPILNEMAPDAIEVLKLTSLIVRLHNGKQASGGVRQGDLLKINRSLIIQYWPEALGLYIKALAYCKSSFGIKNGEMIPSWSLVLGLSAWLANSGSDDRQINCWWKNRVITQYFAQAANTRIVSDFEDATSILPPAYSISRDQLTIFSEPTKKNGLLAKGFAGLLVHSGAKDIVTGAPFDNGEKIVFRALKSDGTINRINSQDSFLVTVIVTEKSDRLLGRSARLEDYPGAYEALISQGVLLEDFTRGEDFLLELFS